MIKILIEIIQYYNYLVLSYFLFVCTFYLILNIITYNRVTKYIRRVSYLDLDKVFRYDDFKPISIVVPAYNEQNGIIDSVKSLLQLEYPEYQVIVVNDGSTDDTLKILFEQFSIRQVAFTPYTQLESQTIKAVYMSAEYPSLVVVDKENGGKADAINAGVNVAKNPLVTVIDADSILERDCLLKIVRPFMEDENVVAVGGTIRIANGCTIKQGTVMDIGLSKSWLARFQVVEYLRAFLFGRNGFEALNGILIISGAFSCFRRDALIKIGGYRVGCIGEDMEIIVRMQKGVQENKLLKLRVTFIPDPVCWTEAPEKLKVLRSQRTRWQKGTVDSLILHSSLFLNMRYGWLGTVIFPYFTIFEMLGPFIEITGYFVFLISILFNIVSIPFRRRLSFRGDFIWSCSLCSRHNT